MAGRYYVVYYDGRFQFVRGFENENFKCPTIISKVCASRPDAIVAARSETRGAIVVDLDGKDDFIFYNGRGVEGFRWSTKRFLKNLTQESKYRPDTLFRKEKKTSSSPSTKTTPTQSTSNGGTEMKRSTQDEEGSSETRSTTQPSSSSSSSSSGDTKSPTQPNGGADTKGKTQTIV